MNARRCNSLLLSEYEYSCGSPITTPGHNLHGKLLVRLNIDCSSCMETSYYSANLDRLDICYYCGASGAEIDNDLKKTVQKCISPMYRLWKKGFKYTTLRPFGKAKKQV